MLVPTVMRSFALLALAVAVGSSACSSEADPASPETELGAPPAEADASAAGDDTDASASAPDAARGDDADAGTPPIKSYDLGPSAGCTKAKGATGLASRTMTVAGTKRQYLRFVPPSYAAGKPLALVVGFHGSGGTAAKARAMFDLEAEAAGGALFLYPQGLPDPAFDGDNRWDATKGSDDYAFVDAILAEAEASYCVDRDRVFAVGFSNGARMTAMLGCYRGDTIRAIAPVAPGGSTKTLPLDGCVGEVSIWEGLGDDDTKHLAGATIVRDSYREANGCAATRAPTKPAGCEAYDGCRSTVKNVWCTYPGGHAWPSIGSAGVWSFFSALK